MFRYFLASRYLWSRPISKVSMIGIFLSVLATIVVVSVMNGFLRDHRRFARGTTADLVLEPQPSFDAAGSPVARPTYESIEPVLKGVPGVRAVAPRLLRPAMLKIENLAPALLGNRSYRDRNFVRVVGLDPAREEGTIDFPSYLAGNLALDARVDDPSRPFWVEPKRVPVRWRNAPLPRVLMGVRLFEWYSVLKKGDVINLVTLPEKLASGEVKPLSQRCVLAGAFESGNFEFDSSTVLMDLDAARAFAESAATATQVYAGVDPGKPVAEVRDAARTALSAAGLSVDVKTWEEVNARLLDAVANERSIIGVLLLFFVTVATFNIFATLSILVSDKVRDIGVLNALGAPAGSILGVFVNCGLLMALLAASIGTALGVLLAVNLNQVLDFLSEKFGFNLFEPSIFVFTRIPVLIEPKFVAFVFVFTILFALLCAAYPALRAARLDPVKALRHE